jgi:hypothetical protein
MCISSVRVALLRGIVLLPVSGLCSSLNRYLCMHFGSVTVSTLACFCYDCAMLIINVSFIVSMLRGQLPQSWAKAHMHQGYKTTHETLRPG